jgi:hypothetical protein
MDAQLPATPCTQEMRNQVVKLAQQRGMSLSEIQRQAVSLFLRTNDIKNVISDVGDVNSSELQEQAS